MEGLGEFLAEIQVRTLAQHIWAAASHELQYKQEQSVPPAVRRAIYRVSALLETVDLELDRVLAQRLEYVAQVSAKPSAIETDLNVDLLESILDNLWPAANKKKPEDYAELLAELLMAGVKTPKALSDLITTRRQSVVAKDAQIAEGRRRSVEKGEEPTGTTRERAMAGVYFTHVGLTRNVMELAGLRRERPRRRRLTRG